MKKFLVLYRSSQSADNRPAPTSPEQGKAIMDAWIGWAKRTGAALVEMGAPLATSTVLQGTAGPTYNRGYSIVQAESADAAKKLFEGHPHFDGAPAASIELLEVLSM